MPLRSALAAALGAALLLVAVPASVSASASAAAVGASGRFGYAYATVEGNEASGFLNGPADGRCFDLPGVGRENPEPGHSPRNRTDAWATVFGATGGASERLKVRSVVFG